MGGKGLTWTTPLLADPHRMDSCRNQAITTHDSVWPGPGSGGVTRIPDVEKRQMVAELQRFCRAKRKRAPREAALPRDIPVGSSKGGVKARACAANLYRIERPYALKVPPGGRNTH
jgi:hypothetical protein